MNVSKLGCGPTQTSQYARFSAARRGETDITRLMRAVAIYEEAAGSLAYSVPTSPRIVRSSSYMGHSSANDGGGSFGSRRYLLPIC